MNVSTRSNERYAMADPLMRRILKFTCLLASVVVMGTFGYVAIEGWNTPDSFYMTVITLATVGYGETQELSAVGRLYTCFLILISIVCLSCWTACLTSLFVEGDLTGTFKQKKAKKMAQSMNCHTIICGSGTMAQTVLAILNRKQSKVVLIDVDCDSLKLIRARYPNLAIIESSAVDEMALADANVLGAEFVIATLDSDFDNLMIAMTCKDLGTDVKVIARSDDMQVASRMMKIGVEKVICPFHVSGEQAAQFAME